MKYFLIGIGGAFAILLLLGMFAFSSMFVYHMGRISNTNEVVTAVEKVGVTANETKTAVVELKNGVDQLKVITEKNTTSINELKGSVEKIAAKEPVVKVIRIKPEAPKQDDQSATIQKAVENGLTDVKKSINDLGARMDRLDDGQARIEKRVGNIETRMDKIETDVNKMTSLGDINARISLGEEGYKKMKEQQLKKTCPEKDLSGSK